MLGIALLVQLSYVTHRLNWTPIPQPADSPGSVFSEDRAMQHVVALTRGIGDHQVTISYKKEDRLGLKKAQLQGGTRENTIQRYALVSVDRRRGWFA